MVSLASRPGSAGRLAALLACAIVASFVIADAWARTVPLVGAQTGANATTGKARMHGSLIGDWYVESFVPRSRSATQLTATGREHFAGCLDANRNARCDASDPSGTLDFSFLYWQTTNPQTGKPVRGACLHPVVGGTGAFSGAVGELIMHDVYPHGRLHTTYAGTLTYGPTPAARTPASAVVGGTC